MNGRLAGKIALITGIGQGFALMFAREGANVFGNDIDPKAVEAILAIVKSEYCILF
jgi:NAD(P)-dependent dehydrogenase (short-subunit alcohol dehydrogenase family)